MFTTFTRLHIKIAKTGAHCCVAAGPHGAKSNSVSGDCSMDHNEPQWRTNSSFSPPLPRRWDCRFQPERTRHVTSEVPVNGSSASSHSRGSRSGVSREQYPNHHHSVSDGALSYFGSPSDNSQAPRWTPPIQRYDLGEFSTPARGIGSESFVYRRGNEQQFRAGFPSVSSSSLGSPSPLSESSRWASTSKQPILFPPRNFSNRRSFMSKPVYPLVFRNPVSDGETFGIPCPSTGSCMSHRSTFSPELKLRKSLTQHQKMEGSPDANTSSSRREGFRWSNASSNDFWFDGDNIEIMEHIGPETLRSPHSNSARQQKCGLCQRPLWQKSPWCSNRIVRSTDMPVAGVLPCCHIFHADCLEEATPKSQVHEPPCPVCQKAAGNEASISFSEPLQVALRSVRRLQGASAPTNQYASSSNTNLDHDEGDTRRNQTLTATRRGSPSLKSHLKKRFPFKGKTGRDLFGAKLFRSGASSSSSLLDDNNESRHGRLRYR